MHAQHFDGVVNLAAQVGVRYSVKNPQAYVQSNLVGFVNVLEGCRYSGVEHLVFASSSSVYGANTKIPFSVHDTVDHPVSIYGASKKANELMAHTYSHLYRFTNYWIALFHSLWNLGTPGYGTIFVHQSDLCKDSRLMCLITAKMRRDFTYIDDIVEGVVRVLDKVTTS